MSKRKPADPVRGSFNSGIASRPVRGLLRSPGHAFKRVLMRRAREKENREFREICRAPKLSRAADR